MWNLGLFRLISFGSFFTPLVVVITYLSHDSPELRLTWQWRKRKLFTNPHESVDCVIRRPWDMSRFYVRDRLVQSSIYHTRDSSKASQFSRSLCCTEQHPRVEMSRSKVLFYLCLLLVGLLFILLLLGRVNLHSIVGSCGVIPLRRERIALVHRL